MLVAALGESGFASTGLRGSLTSSGRKNCGLRICGLGFVGLSLIPDSLPAKNSAHDQDEYGAGPWACRQSGLQLRGTKTDEANIFVAIVGAGSPFKKGFFGIFWQIAGEKWRFLPGHQRSYHQAFRPSAGCP